MERFPCIRIGAIILTAVFLSSVWISNARSQDGEHMNVLYLDGQGGYVLLPSHFLSGLEEATVEVWVKWEKLRKWARVFDFGRKDFAAAVRGRKTSTALSFVVYDQEGDPNEVEKRDAIEVGRWCHVAAVCGRGGVRLFVDGKLEGESPYRGGLKMVSGGTNLVGKSNWPDDEPFQGYMTEFRVWNKARSHREILSSMYVQLTGQEDGLAGYWRFDKPTSGGILKDLSGHQNHATLIGGARIFTVRGPGLEMAPTSSPPETANAGVPPPPLPITGQKPGHLQVNTSVPASRVYLGGKYVGEAHPGQPLNLQEVGVGEAVVHVEARGFQGLTKTVTLRSNQWTQALFSLVAQNDEMILDLDPTPGNQGKISRGVSAGEEVRVELLAMQKAQGIMLFEAELRFDGRKLRLRRFDPSGLMSGAEAITEPSAQGVTISAALFGRSSRKDRGTLGHVVFEAIDVGDSVQIQLVKGALGDRSFSLSSSVELH